MRSIERPDAIQIQTTEICTTLDTEGDPNLPSAMSHPNPTTALLLTSKPVIHRPESGINPLVDAASYLFSLMGKLKHIKRYKNLEKLHKELVTEIENFKETLEAYPDSSDYLAEYLPISLYAICTTLDDIILSTPWGQAGWDSYSLVLHFNDAPLTSENFLILLERLVLDPAIYIDVIEFFYICLTLGFKSRNAGEFSHEQLEKITNSLYKRIRAYRGNYNKTLAPFPVRMPRILAQDKKFPRWGIIGILLAACIAVFIGSQYLIHTKARTETTIVNTT